MTTAQQCLDENVVRARQMRRHPTLAEAALWQALRSRQVRGVKFRRQKVLGDGVVDFWCPALLLAVEVDGGMKEGDVERDAALAAKGIVTIRVTDQQISDNLSGVLSTIRLVIDARRTALSRLRPVTEVQATGEQSKSFKPARRAISPREARQLMALQP